jgi:hypothetical protein
MSGDLALLVGEVSPYVTAAVSAYGGAVLAKASDQAADATVGGGRRILQRIFGTRAAGEDVPQVVSELAADPQDPDLQAALRVEIRRLLGGDAQAVADVRKMLTGVPVISVTASGERSIAAQSITGVAATGDNATIVR